MQTARNNESALCAKSAGNCKFSKENSEKETKGEREKEREKENSNKKTEKQSKYISYVKLNVWAILKIDKYFRL